MSRVHTATSVLVKRKELFLRAETLYRLRISVSLEKLRINFTPSFLLQSQGSDREWITQHITPEMEVYWRNDSRILQLSRLKQTREIIHTSHNFQKKRAAGMIYALYKQVFQDVLYSAFARIRRVNWNCSYSKSTYCLAVNTGKFCPAPDNFLLRGVLLGHLNIKD